MSENFKEFENFKQIVGATKEAPLEIEGYPYGFLTTKKRYWIEYKKGYGQKLVTQTQDPKSLRWNKPKASTYSSGIVLIGYETQPDGREFVIRRDIDGYDITEEELLDVPNRFVLDGIQKKILNALIIDKRASKYIKWEIKPYDPNTPSQTIEEKIELHKKVRNYAYAELKEEGKIVNVN